VKPEGFFTDQQTLLFLVRLYHTGREQKVSLTNRDEPLGVIHSVCLSSLVAGRSEDVREAAWNSDLSLRNNLNLEQPIAALVESNEQGQRVFQVLKHGDPVDDAGFLSFVSMVYKQDVYRTLQVSDDLTVTVHLDLPPRDIERTLRFREDGRIEGESIEELFYGSSIPNCARTSSRPLGEKSAVIDVIVSPVTRNIRCL
jgi:hypothetical protein